MTRLLCIASPAYLAAHGTPQVPEDLNAHRCILYASVEAPGGNPWSFSRQGKPLRIRAPASFTFNDGSAIAEAARAGLGIAQNLEMLARKLITRGELLPVLERWTGPAMPVALMSAQDRYRLPHVRAVMDFLTEHIDWGLS